LGEKPLWIIFKEVDGTKHVFPKDDLLKHGLKDCWCKPVSDDGIIVHKSADMREDDEIATLPESV